MGYSLCTMDVEYICINVNSHNIFLIKAVRDFNFCIPYSGHAIIDHVESVSEMLYKVEIFN